MKKDPTDFSTVEVWSMLYSKSIGTKKKPDFANDETLYFANQKEAREFEKKNSNDKCTIDSKPNVIKFRLLNKRNCKGSLREILNTWED